MCFDTRQKTTRQGIPIVKKRRGVRHAQHEARLHLGRRAAAELRDVGNVPCELDDRVGRRVQRLCEQRVRQRVHEHVDDARTDGAERLPERHERERRLLQAREPRGQVEPPVRVVEARRVRGRGGHDRAPAVEAAVELHGDPRVDAAAQPRERLARGLHDALHGAARAVVPGQQPAEVVHEQAHRRDEKVPERAEHLERDLEEPPERAHVGHEVGLHEERVVGLLDHEHDLRLILVQDREEDEHEQVRVEREDGAEHVDDAGHDEGRQLRDERVDKGRDPAGPERARARVPGVGVEHRKDSHDQEGQRVHEAEGDEVDDVGDRNDEEGVVDDDHAAVVAKVGRVFEALWWRRARVGVYIGGCGSGWEAKATRATAGGMGAVFWVD